jgi:hypothetical protein
MNDQEGACAFSPRRVRCLGYYTRAGLSSGNNLHAAELCATQSTLREGTQSFSQVTRMCRDPTRCGRVRSTHHEEIDLSFLMTHEPRTNRLAAQNIFEITGTSPRSPSGNRDCLFLPLSPALRERVGVKGSKSSMGLPQGLVPRVLIKRDAPVETQHLHPRELLDRLDNEALRVAVGIIVEVRDRHAELPR